MTERPEMRWIRLGIVAGLVASALYPALLFAPLPLALTAAAAGLLGPAIGLGSLGLRQLVHVHTPSVTASVGAICNLLAGALFTAMILVQLAVRVAVPDMPPSAHHIGVWLGLDVAWDMYIGLGTLFFSVALIRHPRFGWPFAAPGLAIAIALLGLNLATFPTPPAEAGSFDVGPLVGLWYLATTIQAWRSLDWARTRLEESP